MTGWPATRFPFDRILQPQGMISELKTMWMEAVVRKFDVRYWYLLGRTKEDHENIQNLWPPGRDLHPGPPKYEVEVLLTRPFSVEWGSYDELRTAKEV
jgi:hypothetical protein